MSPLVNIDLLQISHRGNSLSTFWAVYLQLPGPVRTSIQKVVYLLLVAPSGIVASLAYHRRVQTSEGNVPIAPLSIGYCPLMRLPFFGSILFREWTSLADFSRAILNTVRDLHTVIRQNHFTSFFPVNTRLLCFALCPFYWASSTRFRCRAVHIHLYIISVLKSSFFNPVL